MRYLALIFTCILSLTFATPAQAAETCECAPFDQMTAPQCCPLPVDCCWEAHAEPAHAFDWLWERTLPQVAPQLIQLATLPPLDEAGSALFSFRLSSERPPPLSGRTFRSFQQAWLI